MSRSDLPMILEYLQHSHWAMEPNVTDQMVRILRRRVVDGPLAADEIAAITARRDEKQKQLLGVVA